MSGSNCCFLICIQISQEAGKVVWYSHLFQNFPQCVVIHTATGFSIINEAKVGVFWDSLAFSMMQQMLAIWSLVPRPFLNPACTSGNSQFKYCWSLAGRILRITLLACEMNTVVPFFWDWDENSPFPVLWSLLSFPNLLAYWVQHFHSIIFLDLKKLSWNSITSTRFVHSNASEGPLDFTVQDVWL